MTYDVVVVGLGPAGITTAIHLMNMGKSVLILESNSSAGGCWSDTYINELYFSEHSPKVLFSFGSHYFKALLSFLKVKPTFRPVYSKKTSVFLSACYRMFVSFNFMDYVRLFIYVFQFLFKMKTNSEDTVWDWMVNNHISPGARKTIEMVCIVINGTKPGYVKMNNLIGFVLNPSHLFGLIQLSNPKQWLNRAYHLLSKNTNISIRFNVKVDSIRTHHGIARTLVTHTGEEINSNQIILCVPIRNLLEISSRSEKSIQRNWFSSLHEFQEYVVKSSYSGIGIQFHFGEKIISKPVWCWSCTSEWVIIVIDKGNTLNQISRDESIRTLWSCVLCDTTAKNKQGKTPNDYQHSSELALEVLRQVSNQHGKALYPKHTTISNTVYRSNHGWESASSSFTNTMGKLSYTGKIGNLHTVGPHTTDEIVVVDSAIKSSLEFCKNVLKIKPLF